MLNFVILFRFLYLPQITTLIYPAYLNVILSMRMCDKKSMLTLMAWGGEGTFSHDNPIFMHFITFCVLCY